MSDEREETMEAIIAEMRRRMPAMDDHGWTPRLTAALAREREAVLKVAEEIEDTKLVEAPGFPHGEIHSPALFGKWAAELRRIAGGEK